MKTSGGKIIVILTAIIFTSMMAGCETFDITKPLVYDRSVPVEQSCTLVPGGGITVRKFDGKSVSWHRAVVIPAGEHEFEVDYNVTTPVGAGRMERHSSSGIIVSGRFIPGHEYTTVTQEDTFNRIVNVWFQDNTAVAAERAREKAEEESNFKARLPVESFEPTSLEGIWVWSPEGWSPRTLSITGNVWEYNWNRAKGLFVIDGDVLTLFKLFGKQGDEWVPETDYRNAVVEYRFTLDADGSLRMTSLRGSSTDGPFYKDQAR
jgi:hypothetical protein